MMTDLAVIRNIAERCRRGLQSPADHPGSMFAGFPKGSYGPAAEIVGRIIKEKTGYEGLYVCGSGHASLKPSQTHAWYEVGAYIIDITYDQFEGTGLTGWVFRRGEGWHSQFSDLDLRNDFCMPTGWPYYPFDGYHAVTQEVSNQQSKD
jgi:hypothetical protein